MKIAVVILNWNGVDLLKKFLPSVITYSPEASIYVIDNASTDGSISYLQQHHPGVQIISLDQNYGYAGGYNRGLQQIEADVYALVNSDLEVTQNWLQPIILEFTKHPETAIIQPKIKDYKNKKKFEYAGAAGGYLDLFGYPYCDGRILFKVAEDTGQYNRRKEIFWASGACLLVRKPVFDQLQGFDESFFAHQEEIDFCWRAHHQQNKAVYVPESTVYHLGGASLSNHNPFKTYLNFRNNLLMMLKNLPKSLVAPIIFSRLLLDGLAGIVFMLQGKPKHTWAIVKAHFGFYKRIPQALKQRPKKPIKNYYQTFSIFIKK